MVSLFEKYPYIKSLRGLVSDELIISEIGPKVDEFELNLARARESIPSVNLNKIFPGELESGSITLEKFLGHWGNVSIEELCKICLIVNFIKPNTILEIGTYNGMTTLQMALNAPRECTTYTLDLPEAISASLPLSELDTRISRHFKEQFGTATGSYFKGRNDIKIVQLLGDSSTFDFDALKCAFDIIFIDAAHDYENKKTDSENAFRLLSRGGVILWHNFNDVLCPDVTKYLADISIAHRIFHLRNTSLAVYYNAR